MLYSSECKALRQEDKNRFERSEKAMLLWMCNFTEQRLKNTDKTGLSRASF